MKKNNRGFLLAESLVVSTFVLTVLILLYIQFNNLTTNYKNSYNYNNVESIYDLSSVSDYLLNNNYNLSNQLTASKPYVVVYKNGSCNMDVGIIDTFCDNLINKMDAKTVIYTSSDISAIQKYVSENDDSNINQKLREFISRVETNTVQNKGRLFAEFNNGTYATIAMDNTAIIEEPEISNVIQSWSNNSTSDFHSDEYKASIVTATFVDTREVPSSAIESWDVSSAKDGGVMAWVVQSSTDNTKYDLYIGADGGVVANQNMGYLFYNFSSLSTVKINDYLDTSNTTDFHSMFYGCSSLKEINLNNWNTSKVTNMAQMFALCTNLVNIYIDKFNTSNVTNMSYLFQGCQNLRTLNISNWDTKKVTMMTDMFHGCFNLQNINLNSWDTSNVVFMGNMFANCKSFTTLDLSNWNTSKATTMNSMFYGCDKLQTLKLNKFNTSKATKMQSMFSRCPQLKSILVGSNWTTANADTTNMFQSCGVSSVTRV